MVDLTPVLQAVISLAAVLITGWLIPWIKTNIDTKKQQMLAALIKTLVYAAEQIYVADGSGEYKYEYVKRELKKRGYTVDTAAIEAAVRELAAEGAEKWCDPPRDEEPDNTTAKEDDE